MNKLLKSWKLYFIPLPPWPHPSTPLSLEYSIQTYLKTEPSIIPLQQKHACKLRFKCLAIEISVKLLLNWVKCNYCCKDKTDQKRYYKVLTGSKTVLATCILTARRGLSLPSVHSLWKITIEVRHDFTRNLLWSLVLTDVNTPKTCSQKQVKMEKKFSSKEE